MILGRSFVCLICFKRDCVAGIGTINAHTALDAATNLAAKSAGHVLFLMQVFLVLVNVSEAVDGFASDVALGRG